MDHTFDTAIPGDMIVGCCEINGSIRVCRIGKLKYDTLVPFAIFVFTGSDVFMKNGDKVFVYTFIDSTPDNPPVCTVFSSGITVKTGIEQKIGNTIITIIYICLISIMKELDLHLCLGIIGAVLRISSKRKMHSLTSTINPSSL